MHLMDNFYLAYGSLVLGHSDMQEPLSNAVCASASERTSMLAPSISVLPIRMALSSSAAEVQQRGIEFEEFLNSPMDGAENGEEFDRAEIERKQSLEEDLQPR